MARMGFRFVARAAVFLTLVCGYSPLSTAREGTQQIPLNSETEGAIAAPWQVDRWEFEAIEATKVSLEVKAKGFSPFIAIHNAASGDLIGQDDGVKKAQLAVTLPATARYRVSIRALDPSTTGEYKASITANDVFGFATLQLPDGVTAVPVVPFTAVAGMTLSGKLTLASATAPASVWVKIIGPGGEIPLDGHLKQKKGGKKLILNDLPLALSGDYAITGTDPSVVFEPALALAVPKTAKAILVTREPVPDKLPASTQKTSIKLKGSAVGALSTIQVTGGSDVAVMQSDGDRRFKGLVSLKENAINRLYLTEIAADGTVYLTTPISIIHDDTPPTVTLVHPAPDHVVFGDAVTIVGTVSDMLGGDKLIVEVGGEKAKVHIGIGTDGSFVANNVPLPNKGTNIVKVTAKDSYGNDATTTFALQRAKSVKTDLHVVVVSGDGQTGKVGAALDDPLVVRVVDDAGKAVADKVVTFRVLLGDGEVSPNGGGDAAPSKQVLTDASGIARVTMTLGSDVGPGSNAVLATSVGAVTEGLFLATGKLGEATRVSVVDGDDQSASPEAILPIPLVVRATDGANPIADLKVVFRVTAGGGMVDDRTEKTFSTDELGRAEARLRLGPGAGPNRVEVLLPGTAEPAVVFQATAVAAAPLPQQTRFHGLVTDNANRPIGGAQCVLRVNGVDLSPVLSDAAGRFAFADVQVGVGELFVDGLVATTVGGGGVPAGSFPSLHFENFYVLAGRDNSLLSPIRLPGLNPANARVYDGTADVELTVAEVDGLKMTVLAGSMTRADGSVPTKLDPAVVSLNQVHFDEIPMALPDGIATPFAWTLQPAGAEFWPPVRVEIPNMTALPAGSTVSFLTFSHATGKFEVEGVGRVSADASRIVSDLGTGLTLAGWGSSGPPAPPTGDVDSCTDDPQIAAQIAQLQVEKQAAINAASMLFEEGMTEASDLIGPDGGLPFTQIGAKILILKTSWTAAEASFAALRGTWAIAQIACIIALPEPTPFGEFACAALLLATTAEFGLFIGSTASAIAMGGWLLADLLDFFKALSALSKFDQALTQIEIAATKAAAIGAICLALGVGDVVDQSIQNLQQKIATAKAKLESAKQKLDEYKTLIEKVLDSLAKMKETVEQWKQEIDDFLDGVPGTGTLSAGDAAAAKTLCEVTLPTGAVIVIEVPDGVECDPDIFADVIPNPDILTAHDDDVAVVNDSLSEAERKSQGLGEAIVDAWGASLEVATGADDTSRLLTFEGWSVSAGGQVGTVDPDGTFILPNLAADGQIVRVIAELQSADPPLYGVSEFFTVTANQSYTLQGTMPIGPNPPVTPLSLSISPSNTIVMLPGEMRQLIVQGAMSDGSVVDLTGPRVGSTIVSTNPEVASVTENGLVTSVGLGTAFLTVSNQGVTAIRRVDVEANVVFTTVLGLVRLENGKAAKNAAVSVSGSSGATIASTVTDGAGSFFIPDLIVPTDPLSVRASLQSQGEFLVGSTSNLDPVPAGFTEAYVTLEPSNTVLVFGSGSGNGFRTDLLQFLLDLGYDAVLETQLPEDLTPYQSAWFLDAFDPLSPAEQKRLIGFVESGRGLYLSGERTCCEALNATVELVVNGLVVGGNVQVGGLGDIAGPYFVNPNAKHKVGIKPNVLEVFNASGPGGMALPAGQSAANVFARGAADTPIGAVWSCDDLVSGNGRLVVLMDSDWVANTDARELVDNVQRFLIAAGDCP